MRAEHKRRIAAIAPTVIYTGAVRAYIEPLLVDAPFDPAWLTRVTAIGVLILLFSFGDMVPDEQWNAVGIKFSVGFFMISMVVAIMLVLVWAVGK